LVVNNRGVAASASVVVSQQVLGGQSAWVDVTARPVIGRAQAPAQRASAHLQPVTPHRVT